LILSEIGRSPGTSRRELAERFRLVPATVGTHVRKLVEHGFIAELDAEPTRSGRPSIPLTLAPNRGILLGITLQPTRAVIVAVAVDGTVLDRASTPFDSVSADFTGLACAIHSAIERQRPRTVIAIGVTVSGVIDTTTGTVIMSTVLGWRNRAVGAPLTALTGLPVVVENDVMALANRELTFSSSVPESFLLTHLDEGVGMAIVADNTIVRGIRHGSVEFGHISRNPAGALCRCGNRGCMQTVFGWQELNDTSPDGFIPDDVDDVSDPVRTHLRDRAADLGHAVGSVSTLLGIDHVRITGRTGRYWSVFGDSLVDALTRSTVTLGSSPAVDVVPWTGDDIAAGAAGVALGAYLDSLR